MTTACLSIDTTSFLPKARDFGRSQEAEHVFKLFEEIEDDYSGSITIGNYYQKLEALIYNAVKDHLNDSPDMNPSDIINLDSYSNSIKFIKMLPTSFPLPNVYIETDGMVEFEWYIDSRHLFSVTIEGSNRLIYAGIFGDDITTYGTERFAYELQRVIFSNIQRLYSRS